MKLFKLTVFLSMVFLCACNNENATEDLHQYIQTAQKEITLPIEQPTKPEKQYAKPKKPKKRLHSIFAEDDIQSIHLIGTLVSNHQSLALIMDSTQAIKIVRPKTIISSEYFIIQKISPYYLFLRNDTGGKKKMLLEENHAQNTI